MYFSVPSPGLLTYGLSSVAWQSPTFKLNKVVIIVITPFFPAAQSRFTSFALEAKI